MQAIGPYRLLRRLGVSPVGSVWSAVDAGGDQVTIALLDGAAAADPRVRNDFAATVNTLVQPRPDSADGSGALPVVTADFSAAQPWVACADAGGAGAAGVFVALGLTYAPLADDPGGDATVVLPMPASAPPPPAPAGPPPLAGPPPVSAPPLAGQPPPITGPAPVAGPPPVGAPPGGGPAATGAPVSGAPPMAGPEPPADGPPGSGSALRSGTPPASGAPLAWPPPVASGPPLPGPLSAPPLSGPPLSGPLSGPPVSGAAASAPSASGGPVAPYPVAYHAPTSYHPPGYQLAPYQPDQPAAAPAVASPPGRTGLRVGLVALLVLLAGAGAGTIAVTARPGGEPVGQATASTSPAGPDSPAASAPSAAPPSQPGIEPPLEGGWPGDWPQFADQEPTRRMTGLDGLGFTFRLPGGWECTPRVRAAGLATYDCGANLAGSGPIGGELTVRGCPDPCDGSRRVAMRRGVEAWGLEWTRGSDFTTWAETAEIDGQPRYGLVFVMYWRTSADGPLNRQLVFRMTSAPQVADDLQKVANSVRDAVR